MHGTNTHTLSLSPSRPLCTFTDSRTLMSVGMEKIMSCVLPSCRVSPSTEHHSRTLAGSAMRCAGMVSLTGQKVSYPWLAAVMAEVEAKRARVGVRDFSGSGEDQWR